MLRFGPFELAFWQVLVLLALLVLAVWIVRGFLIRVQGTWERVDEGLNPGHTERITLVQFGPFVRGRRLVKGGFQEFTGLLRGRTIFMTRRDHGEDLIVSQGFPRELVPEIDGTVTARLRLTLSADSRAIFGTFTPQKIEFTYRPLAITNRTFLEPSFRRYKLVSREIVDEPGHSLEPRPEERRTPVGKTV